MSVARARAGRAAPLAGIALVALAVNAAEWLRAKPEPLIHDEFSYLLAADTFASGRLTNDTHPMWRHFETFHVIHEPSYQSKYPPGQGLVLAAGQALTGHPIAGVWLSFAAACAAVAWMLAAWLPRRWAIAGSLLLATHPLLGAWWAQTYWGGAVAVLGGALVYGAVPRLIRGARGWSGAWLGAGLGILALSRPVEGALASIPPLALLALRVRPAHRKEVAGRLVPGALIAAAAIGWLGYYHWRVTGDAFRAPYQVWLETYQPEEGTELHPDLRRYRGSPPLPVGHKLSRLRSTYLPAPLALMLVGLRWTWRSRWTRLLAGSVALVVAPSVAFSAGWPHYVAPVAGPILALVTQGLRGLWVAGAGRAWTRPAVSLLAVPVLWLHTPLRPPFWFHARLGRDALVRVLESEPPDDLVFVRYSRAHDATREWVFNAADIDAAPIVWARELGPARDLELMRYFGGRRVWLWEPDGQPPRLQPHPFFRPASPPGTSTP